MELKPWPLPHKHKQRLFTLNDISILSLPLSYLGRELPPPQPLSAAVIQIFVGCLILLDGSLFCLKMTSFRISLGDFVRLCNWFWVFFDFANSAVRAQQGYLSWKVKSVAPPLVSPLNDSVMRWWSNDRFPAFCLNVGQGHSFKENQHLAQVF